MEPTNVMHWNAFYNCKFILYKPSSSTRALARVVHSSQPGKVDLEGGFKVHDGKTHMAIQRDFPHKAKQCICFDWQLWDGFRCTTKRKGSFSFHPLLTKAQPGAAAAWSRYCQWLHPNPSLHITGASADLHKPEAPLLTIHVHNNVERVVTYTNLVTKMTANYNYLF